MSSKVDLPEEVRLKYIDRRKTDVQECRAALTSRNFSHLARVGHQLKGNASTFGYDELAEIAIDMEKFALEQNAEGLDAVMLRFATYVEQMH